MSKSNEYKGFNSMSLGDNYDDITQKTRDIAQDCGGIIDVRSKYKGTRAKFNSKEARDEFNDKIKKLNKAQSGDTKNTTLESIIREEINKLQNTNNRQMNKVYTVKQLKAFIRESVENEFAPKFGDNVQKDNKKNNEKAYSDIEKATKDYDGGLVREKSFKLPKDDNRGMESLVVNNPNKEYSDRIKAQAKGFTSADAEKIHGNEKLGNAEYGSDETVQQFKKKGEENSQGRAKATEIGLTGRELDKKEVEKQHKPIYAENKIKKLTFKNTEFINEEHVLAKVPDLYMTEGNKFIMCDKNQKQYMVEWHDNEPKISRYYDKNYILAEQENMKRLTNYRSQQTHTTNTVKLNENKEISNMLDKVRKLMK